MTGHDAVRRLMAYAAGKPLPNGETLRVPKPEKSIQTKDSLILAFVRMGGESAPWGVAFGPPETPSRCLDGGRASKSRLCCGHDGGIRADSARRTCFTLDSTERAVWHEGPIDQSCH